MLGRTVGTRFDVCQSMSKGAPECSGFPDEVVDDFGYALGAVQQGIEEAVYVLHGFQKKSPSGVRTAMKDVDLIHVRLKAARNDYEVRYGKKA